jgi:hypothetical protein
MTELRESVRVFVEEEGTESRRRKGRARAGEPKINTQQKRLQKGERAAFSLKPKKQNNPINAEKSKEVSLNLNEPFGLFGLVASSFGQMDRNYPLSLEAEDGKKESLNFFLCSFSHWKTAPRG